MAYNPMMEGVLSTGVRGMQTGIQGMQEAAQTIAELNRTAPEPAAGSESGDDRGGYLENATEALTSLRLYERQVEASAKVVETADEVLGFLIDVRA